MGDRDTTIETADLRLVLSRPWPPNCSGGPLQITTDARWLDDAEQHYGYLGVHGDPDREDAAADVAVLDAQGRRIPPAGRKVFGVWPTLDAACDAAWQAHAEYVAGEMIVPLLAAVDRFEGAASDLAHKLAPTPEQAAARLARAAELHQCAACRQTFRGQAPAYVVLEEHTLVDLEGARGEILYSGPADGWGPKLVEAVTAAGKGALDRQRIDFERRLDDHFALEAGSRKRYERRLRLKDYQIYALTAGWLITAAWAYLAT